MAAYKTNNNIREGQQLNFKQPKQIKTTKTTTTKKKKKIFFNDCCVNVNFIVFIFIVQLQFLQLLMIVGTDAAPIDIMFFKRSLLTIPTVRDYSTSETSTSTSTSVILPNTVLVYIQEQCYDHNLNMTTIEQYLNTFQYDELNFVLMDRNKTCTMQLNDENIITRNDNEQIQKTINTTTIRTTSTSSSSSGTLPVVNDDNVENVNNVNAKHQQLSDLVEALANDNVLGMIGSPAPSHCETIVRLARVWHKNLVTWTCPHHHTTSSNTVSVQQKFPQQISQRNERQPASVSLEDRVTLLSDDEEPPSTTLIPAPPNIVSRSLIAPVSIVASSLAAVIHELRWKSLIIITSDEGWWQSLAHELDLTLRQQTGIVAKLFITVPQDATAHERIAKLVPLNNMPSRAIIICTSLHPLGKSILSTIDNMRIVHRYGTFIILVDITSLTPYLKPSSSSHVTPNSNNNNNNNNTFNSTTDINNNNNNNNNNAPVTNLYNINVTSTVSSIVSNIVNVTSTIPTTDINNNTMTFTTLNNNNSPFESTSSTTTISSPATLFPSPTKPFLLNSTNFIEQLTVTSQRNLLIYSATDIRENITELFAINKLKLPPTTINQQEKQSTKNSTETSPHDNNFIINYLNESINLIYQNYKGINVQEKIFQFLLLDWYNVNDPSIIGISGKNSNIQSTISSHWRPLFEITYNNTLINTQYKRVIVQPPTLTSTLSSISDQQNVFIQNTNSYNNNNNSISAFIITKIEQNFNDWKWRKLQLKTYLDACDDEDPSMAGACGIQIDLPMTTAHILLIIACSILTAIVVIIGAIITRYHVVKKRLAKGPYKILLTATDFVFPTISDSRRVDEGIEAMLCCWLQQLQEFGGPEVDKPDLLKGSVASLKGHATVGQIKGIGGSTSSLARTLLVDPRVRYNGDLVQLKELPSNQGGFELKSKAMDVLVMIHGLRHENLNPFIGLLTEPSRPGLVSEWCTRGSLEDVLIMDDIKLDWSFRLSLLTDLVRGMRYLHSTPIRVHGYLTSRNCVIDARWVLKITDYGLPAFYEAQNITPMAKSARDLLWTAPELLRNASLRKRGTQLGDVYSFGIIMQEVVVRGEPFCMLALTPEEIIEKVKRPPPLIRPSVSKGAAPPEAINIMRQCWAEQPEMRPDFNAVHDLFKKLNHGRKVNFVDTMFQMLEKYSNNLEELIRERTEQLDMEKKKTEQLLNRMLPSSVAEKLKLGMPVDPEEFREVTIYFSDIVGFTTISAYSTPFQVVDLLNDLYTCFDATINAYNVYKVETIGDAYMVVGGLPVRIPDHAEQIATMALDLLHQSGKFKIRHLPRTPLRLRIGLHTGPCCAGVVGLTMPRYCLFGDTVNTASRMESTGSAWRIHMSQATKEKLEQAGGYQIEYRGLTEVKGKGYMNTYWLLGKTGFDKPLPTPPPIGLDECLVIYGKGDPSHNSSFNTNRSEDNSSGDCSSSIGIPTGQGSPCPPQNADMSSSSENNQQQTNVPPKGIIKVCAAVHEESIKKTDTKSLINATTTDPSKFLNLTTKSNTFDQANFRNLDTLQHMASKTHDTSTTTTHHTAPVVKSTSTDTPVSTLGTPVSASDVAAALLGASTSSLSNPTVRSSTRPHRVGVIDEDNLSSAYNRYRCLSPNDARLTMNINVSTDRNPSTRLLKRQFSLDRGDDTRDTSHDTYIKPVPRLSKQNSAGAAHDLERIEEIPLSSAPSVSPCHHYRHKSELTPPFSCSLSISVDSLSLQ